ncbi:DUF1461 domain-containing protein [Candidatus Woesearchaeota archaeon]|nr:DUF1461 domain-containing protein [Candidatus Woesearchaeota archaeon]
MAKKKGKKTANNERKKRRFEKHALIIVAIIFASVLIITPFELMLYFRPVYQIHFASTGVYDQLGKEKADSILWEVLEFMDGQTDTIEGFNQGELSHMGDVKNVLEKIVWIFFLLKIFQIFLWFYLSSMNQIMKSVYYAGIIAVCVIFVLLVVSTCCFDFAFLQFHKVFFPQGNYTFDASASLMKTMFPDKFFRNFAIVTTIFSLLVSLGAILVGKLYFKYVPVSTQK